MNVSGGMLKTIIAFISLIGFLFYTSCEKNSSQAADLKNNNGNNNNESFLNGKLAASASKKHAVDAWENFKKAGLTSDYTPNPDKMLRQFWNADTRGEYHSWALIMAVSHGELETAEKLWNFCRYYIPLQDRGMIPWLIQKDYKTYAGSNVTDADLDYAIALDMAARKWPEWNGDDGKSWGDWAEYYIGAIYNNSRAILENPGSPNAVSGKYMDPDGPHKGVDEHYYLHYSGYGYFKNFSERTGQKNWIERTDGLESVYEAEINLQKKTLAKYYGESAKNPYCWPPHQVRKNGGAANDLTKKYDSGWSFFGWGPARICARAAHAFLNYGDPHAEKMMTFLADRWKEETNGDPSLVRKGYSLENCSGWENQSAWMLGSAAMVSMVSDKYQNQLDHFYDALVNLETESPHDKLAKAYYLLVLNGMMDFNL